jgi:multicomponent Na+:H+ antiporter subunit E
MEKKMITFILLMLGWILFTLNFQFPSLLLGAVFSVIITAVASDILMGDVRIDRGIFRRIGLFFVYFFVLLYEIYLAGLDVAYRVITMSINPEVVMVRTDLKGFGIVLLANSITLTPGTITIDIEDDWLYVHWLYARTTHFAHYSEMIKGRFERWLRWIF